MKIIKRESEQPKKKNKNKNRDVLFYPSPPPWNKKKKSIQRRYPPFFKKINAVF